MAPDKLRKRVLEADRLRRAMHRQEQQAALRASYQNGLARGRAEPRQLPIPADFTEMVIQAAAREFSHYAARHNGAANRGAIVLIAEVCETAFSTYAWDMSKARAFAEYLIDEQGITFSFEIPRIAFKETFDIVDIKMMGGG